jgi:site-specific recombinase XerD
MGTVTAPDALLFVGCTVGDIFTISMTMFSTSEQAAHDQVESFRRAANGETVQLKTVGKTVEEAITLFLAAKTSKGVTGKHVSKLRFHLQEQFLTFCNARGLMAIADVRTEHLEMWRSEWTGAVSTRRKLQGRIKGLFDYCFRRDWITKDPTLAA